MLTGSDAATGLRNVLLTFFALTLRHLHFIRLEVAVRHMWMGIKFVAPDDEDGDLDAVFDLAGVVGSISIPLMLSLSARVSTADKTIPTPNEISRC